MNQFNHIGNNLKELSVDETSGVRFYVTPEGFKYPSVTTALGYETKDGIERWKKRVGLEEAARVSKKATEIGTRIHLLTEHYLKNNTKNLLTLTNESPFLVQNMFNNFTSKLNNINNIVALEAPLYSNIIKLAGRTDCIAEYEGKLSIIDFKTSRSLKEERWIESYFMQGTAYSIMYQDLTKQKIEDIIIMIVNYDCSVDVFKKKRNDYVKPLITLLRRVLPNFGVTCEI